MINILVTGAKGFVGSHICNHLKNEYNIFQPSRSELDLLNRNQVIDFFQANKIDSVIHCALSGREDLASFDPKYISDNLLMFQNLYLNKHRFCQFINMGTCFEYDQDRDNFYTEEHESNNVLPKTSYAYSKNIIGRIINNTENFYNLRLFYVFHETESPKRFLKKVLHATEITIHNDQYVDYIYLDDLLPMIKTILDGKCKDKVVNMVYPEKFKLSEIAYMLCEYLNIDKSKIQIAGSNGINMIGNSQRLSSYGFNLVGLKKGLGNYKLCY